MTEQLTLRYRPRTFADVAGQMQVVGVLYRMACMGTVPPVLLFTGQHGCGKTSTARLLAAALNCEQEQGSPQDWPCGSCPSCKATADGTSLDVIEIDAASNGGKEEVLRLKELVQYSSVGRKHVVILDEAHSMSGQAFNSLLKLLEEPPPDTVFMLLTTEVGKIPQTVFSRCMPFTFRRLTAPVIMQRLAYICQQEGIAAEPALLQELAERADGAMRDAVRQLDQMHLAGIATLERYLAIMGESDHGLLLAEAMVAGQPSVLFPVLDAALTDNGDYGQVASQLIFVLRDVLVLLGSGGITAQGCALARRQALAQKLDAPRVVTAIRLLWDLRKMGRAEPRSALEMAAVLCMEALSRRAEAPQPATNGNGHNGHAPLSFNQLQQYSMAGHQ